MFAIVSLDGKQFKVEANKFIYVNRVPKAEGESLVLDKVLLTANGASAKIGAPYVSGVTVTAKVLAHLKDDKVIVFKKKKRKGYKVKRGHRQQLTKLMIESING